VVGVGRSATVDGGIGLAQSLGVGFWNSASRALQGTITDLETVADLAMPVQHPLGGTTISVACDVRTRLLGPREASAIWIYGPQKGGTEESLARIEAILRRIDDLIHERLGWAFGELECGGAAGGLAAGLATFAPGELRMGMPLFDELVGLDDQVARSDLVITGEGRLDAQSAEGKVVSYVADLARKHGLPVVALCGSADPHGLPLDGVVALTESGLPTDGCIGRPLDALDRVMPRLIDMTERCLSPPRPR
jgi:glycerate kinase